MIEPERLEKLCREHGPVARTAPKLSAAQVVSSLVYHQLQRAGTLAQSARSLHQIGMSDSAFSQRRRGLPQELFEQIAAAALGPLAEPAAQPEAFYRGLRLVGMDGTQCSVSNTPALLQALPKAASRRLEAAFAKLQVVTLMELGVHNHPAHPAALAQLLLVSGRTHPFSYDCSMHALLRGSPTPCYSSSSSSPLLSSRCSPARLLLAQKNLPAFLLRLFLPFYPPFALTALSLGPMPLRHSLAVHCLRKPAWAWDERKARD